MKGVGLVGGADESGRGCLLGPLIVAGISVDPIGSKKLRNLGVKDSKLLSAKKRESLFPEIMKVAEHAQWVAIPPSEIDEVVLTGRRLRKLNYLEAIYFAKVIDLLYARKVTVDASDVIPERFRDDIAENMASKCKVVAYHKADRDYPVVSAASIVAKVVRDREVELLKEIDGDFGSGYPSDPITRSFFSDWMKRGVPFPNYVRQSWKTWWKIEQTLLDQF